MKVRFVFMLAVSLLLLVTVSGVAQEKGGVLRWAMAGDPDTLDGQRTTSNFTGMVVQHVLETLTSPDEANTIQPMLADSWEIQDDGLKWVFHLRQGVLFHNSKEMKSDDVVASLNRWMAVSVRGDTVGQYLETLTATDDYTVVFQLKDRFSELPAFLSCPNSGPFIMPKELVEEAGEAPIDDIIGTGPFYLDIWEMGNYILLTRFEEYKPRPEPASFEAGARVAYLDAIKFVTVPEVSTRIAGVRTGEFHGAKEISYDMYETLMSDPEVLVQLAPGANVPTYCVNKKEGIMSDLSMRHALLAALDMDEIMKAAFVNEDLYTVGPETAFSRNSIYYTDAGKEYHNQKSPKKAKELAEAAGYAGEPIRWIAPNSIPTIYWTTIVGVEQLINAGFNIQLSFYDVATWLQRRADPANWDLFTTYGGWIPSLSQISTLNSTYPGWWENPEKDRLLGEFLAAEDVGTKVAIWEDIEQLIWDEVATIKIGTAYAIHITTPSVRGYEATLQPILWNVSLANGQE